MNIASIWYGWIPNLSGDIFLSDIYEILGERGFISVQNGNYFRSLQISDISSTSYTFSVVVPTEYSNLNDKNTLKVELEGAKAVCEIEKNGMLKLELTFGEGDGGDFELGIARAIYCEIKDIFHEHTHHAEDADRLLDVIAAESKEQAIKKIVQQYQRKIFEYHHFLKAFLYRSQLHLRSYLKERISGLFYWRRRQASGIQYVAQAEGEMLYALLFINLYKQSFDQYRDYQFIFRNAYSSFNSIRNKITQGLQEYANKIMIGLTILITILTILLAVSAFFS